MKVSAKQERVSGGGRASAPARARTGEAGAGEQSPWYASGLRFACTECGKCCSTDSGYVWVSVGEARVLAGALGMDLQDFGRRYLRAVGSGYALLDKPGSGDCIFLDGKRCSVYEARPSQCRSYPWWPQNLRSAQAWAEAAGDCEGINEDARLVTAAEIRDAGLVDSRRGRLKVSDRE